MVPGWVPFKLCPTVPPSIQDGCCYFLFLAWRPSWLEVGITGHNFGRGPSKDHSTKAWFKLAQWLQKSWIKYEKITDGIQWHLPENVFMKFRSQIENQVSDYRLLWASSLAHLTQFGSGELLSPLNVRPSVRYFFICSAISQEKI
jgi:hypothetical protein